MKKILLLVLLVTNLLMTAQAQNLEFCAENTPAAIDLGPQTTIILSEQPPGNFQVTNHLSLTAANSGTGALPAISYFNFGATIIYARISNLADGSFTISTYTVTISTAPQIGSLPDVTACSSYTLPELNVGNYYTSPSGGGVQLPAGTEITATQEIYVFAQIGSCIDQESFMVSITPVPQVALENGIICVSEDGFVFNPYLIDTHLNASEFAFQWSLNGTVLTNGTEPSYLATLPGQYSVTVSTIFQSCSITASATILAATPATEATASFSGSTLTVSVMNPELYQFGLDGQALQESNIFMNVAPGLHEIAVCALNGCGKLVLTIDSSLSLNQNTFTNLSFHPNPVSNVLNFSANEAVENIKVSNLLGQTVISKKLFGVKNIDLSELAKGIYNVQLSAASKQNTFKIIKQ